MAMPGLVKVSLSTFGREHDVDRKNLLIANRVAFGHRQEYRNIRFSSRHTGPTLNRTRRSRTLAGSTAGSDTGLAGSPHGHDPRLQDHIRHVMRGTGAGVPRDVGKLWHKPSDGADGGKLVAAGTATDQRQQARPLARSEAEQRAQAQGHR